MDILTNLLISSGLVSVLGIALWYFIQKWMTQMEAADKNNEEKIDQARGLMDAAIKEAVLGFTVAVNELKQGIAAMNESVGSVKTIVEVIKAQVEERNRSIDQRLTNKREWLEQHDIILNDHEKRLTRNESTCQAFHNRRQG